MVSAAGWSGWLDSGPGFGSCVVSARGEKRFEVVISCGDLVCALPWVIFRCVGDPGLLARAVFHFVRDLGLLARGAAALGSCAALAVRIRAASFASRIMFLWFMFGRSL